MRVKRGLCVLGLAAWGLLPLGTGLVVGSLWPVVSWPAEGPVPSAGREKPAVPSTREQVRQVAERLGASVRELHARKEALQAAAREASIALWKLDGMTTSEIAEKMNCVRRTVERKLQLIAEVWEAA